MPQKINRSFLITAQITLVFVFLVIIAGSIVRATGSGMGCPDWPKCFGKWIPPTTIAELPPDYKEVYAGEHHAVAEFNVWNTWTEYLNRLAGALLGILIFVQLVISIALYILKKENKRLFQYSLIEFILIGFQGWLGAKVVSSNLAPVKITIHMIVALIILSVAILIINKAKALTKSTSIINTDPVLRRMSIIVFICTVFQIMMGTQVREEVDIFLKNFDAIYRGEIIGHLSNTFIIHRSFSIAIVLLNAGFIYRIYKSKVSDYLGGLSKWLSVIIVVEIIAGIVLSRFALPAPAQPIHLLLACITYGLQWMLILKLWKKKAG